MSLFVCFEEKVVNKTSEEIALGCVQVECNDKNELNFILTFL